jgi:predicted N-acyltransferase
MGWQDFDAFLSSLTQEKRKKIRQEQRKVVQAGVQFRHASGSEISDSDWAFFYQCYERTYLEHGNAPYLTPAFFKQMQNTMASNWLLFIAEINGRPIACSLIGLHLEAGQPTVAYGRYWGALERVDCLHFDACYYQPLQWCIAHGVQRFEGGAQGEHKLARGYEPVETFSVHEFADARLSSAVEDFLRRERAHVEAEIEIYGEHVPFKKS